MLKEAQYYFNGRLLRKVVYLIVENRCYFSGIERNGTTINGAEDVMTAIAKQEAAPVDSFRFFDIQTHQGYHRFLPGHYEVNELEYYMGRESTAQEKVEQVERMFHCKVLQALDNAPKNVAECAAVPSVTAWKKTFLPVEVLKEFQTHIGIDLKTMYADVWKESEGLIGVADESGMYFYVHPDGTPAFSERYFDMTPFRDGLAWVTKGDDKWVQIDHEGKVKSDLIDGAILWNR